MKTRILISILLSFAVCANVLSQEKQSWKINSIEAGTGETPLSSGLSLSTSFSKGKNTMFIDFNNILGEVIYFIPLNKNISVGPSGGLFKNTAWAGPIASFSLFQGYLTTLNWVGWSLGDPEEGKTSSDIMFCFSYHQITFSTKFLDSYYALQHYQKCSPEHIFGLKWKFHLNESLFTSFGSAYLLKRDNFIWAMSLYYKFK